MKPTSVHTQSPVQALATFVPCGVQHTPWGSLGSVHLVRFQDTLAPATESGQPLVDKHIKHIKAVGMHSNRDLTYFPLVSSHVHGSRVKVVHVEAPASLF